MGNFRVFKKSVRFTFRSKKRFIVFLLIFGIVSTFIAFYIDSLDSLRTDRFLEQKGVVMLQEDNFLVSYDQGNKMLQDVQSLADNNNEIKIEDHVIYYYAELDSLVRVYTIDINKPWFSDFAKPSLVVDGRYPEKANEILVPAGSSQIFNSSSSNVIMKSKIAVGQEIELINGNEKMDLTVVGTFETTNLQERADKDRLWFFIDQSNFEDILSLYELTLQDAYTYSISFTVPGTLLSKDTYSLVTKLNDAVKPLIDDVVTHGDWEDQPTTLPTTQAKTDASRSIVNLVFVVIGGMILAIMFSYLISRFRRREIAILKAMGYSHSSVRTSLIAEIMTIAFFGFFVGISTAQGLIYYLSDFSKNSIISLEAVGVSFLINVIITLPGMLISSRKVLGVSPSEAFRDR